jgi:hypothetical protein
MTKLSSWRHLAVGFVFAEYTPSRLKAIFFIGNTGLEYRQMKTNRMMTAAAVLLGAMTFTAAIAHAQDNMGDMSGHSHAGHQHMMMSNDAMMMADNGSAPMAAHRVSGEVKKIDLAKGEIKIRHEAIAHLDMMAMTMV